MSESVNPGISVFVCHQCIPDGVRLPRQWTYEDVHIRVKELPCSGKTDAQYLFHAFEGGARGLIVVTCPQGDCHLAQGNYRAAMRVRTVQRLLTEIGMESERAELMHCGSSDDLKAMIDAAVSRIVALGASPLLAVR